MTTTAEKIKELVKELAGLRNRIEAIDAQLQEIAFNVESTPDPEPLECWVSIVGVAEALDDTKDLMAHWSKKEAEEQVYSWPHRLQHTAHMREVTPQMLRDEKDATRYRKFKKLFRASNGDWVFNPLLWDKEIDNEMETGGQKEETPKT